MTDPQVVSRDEWLVARKRLLAHEKELTRRRDVVNAERRGLPMVEVDKEYVFDGPDGKARLLDLFDGRRQLLVYHFMFDPGWDEGCPSCSFLIDHIGYQLNHLHARDTSMVLISRAPIEKLSAYKQRMGWTIPWYSSHGSDFNYDFHVTLDPAIAPLEYNYVVHDEPMTREPDGSSSMEAQGQSAFLRVGDRVFHTYSSYARAGDLLIGTYNWLDHTALGRQEDWEQPPGRSDGPAQSWLHRHDEYGSLGRGDGNQAEEERESQPVVHFEVIGKNPERLREYFGELFGWEFDTPSPVAREVSEPGSYGFLDLVTSGDGTGIRGGVGGGQSYASHAVFYVGVPNVEVALQRAESLGGTRVMGPATSPNGLVVGHFTDPEGTLIGVAGTA
jgi:predicted dithiol-disulfide oxidoreductase (DUF899 family)/predicted enzyme related to lactoylglutathione lyase